MPVQIILRKRYSGDVLLINKAAKNEVDASEDYLDTVSSLLQDRTERGAGHDINIEFKHGRNTRYLRVKLFYMNWHNQEVEVLVILDESETGRRIKALENDIYRDSLTGLYNRAYGMLAMGKWVREKRNFVLVFSDLDSLKYVNDEFGHIEGDMYIINAAKHLMAVKTDAVVCRLGGDEFMLLVPDVIFEDAYHRMSATYRNLTTDAYLQEKKYKYSISFGLVEVTSDNRLSVKELLNIADERMYENKRLRKKMRLNEVDDETI